MNNLREPRNLFLYLYGIFFPKFQFLPIHFSYWVLVQKSA